jgi:hypothetical protein
MKRQYSEERLSKQKAIMKFIREQLRLSDYRKLIYDISARGRDSLDELEVQRRDLSEELRKENPSYQGTLGGGRGTYVERYQGLESQKMRGVVSQLRGVAERLATTALHRFGDSQGEGQRDEVIGSLDLKLSDFQIDDEACHGIIALLSGALGTAVTGTGGGDRDQEDSQQQQQEKEKEEEEQEEGSHSHGVLSRGEKVLARELGISNSSEMHSTASLLAKSFLKIQSNYLDRLLLMNLRGNSLTDISCKILCSLVEKSTSLRMLDLRGNLITANGS